MMLQIDAGQYEEALAELRASPLLPEQIRGPWAYVRLRAHIVLWELGLHAEARALCDETIALARAASEPVAHYYALRARLQQHDLPPAERKRTVLEARSVGLASGDATIVSHVHSDWADSLLNASGDLAGAAEQLRLAQEAEPGVVDRSVWQLCTARRHLRSGDAASAAHWFERACHALDRRTRAQGRAGLAEVELRAGRAEAALRLLHEATADLGEPRGAEHIRAFLWNGVGEAARAAGHLEEADDAYARAARLYALTEPTLVELVRLNRALVQLECGRTVEAAEVLSGLSLRRLPAVIRRAADLARAACAASTGDAVAFDRAFVSMAAGWDLRSAEVDVASCALLAATAAERVPGLEWQIRSARARRVALQVDQALGRTARLPDHLRALRRTLDRGAPALVGPFLVEGRLGKGSFGDVWRARHGSGAGVALKVLRVLPSSSHT